MITEKLYEADGMLPAFRAEILQVTPFQNGYAVVLDRTAFFPEGGGQSADRGEIGGARVTDVQIIGGEILHITEQMPRGGTVDCAIDFAERFRKMQNHLGEHLLCGAIHRLYGYDNVGFHLGADYMTFDIDGVLEEAQIEKVEAEANRAVAADVPVRCYYPSPEALAALPYRAKSEKLEASEAIRIVEAGDFDRCACCAPHPDRTGKVGLIKITDATHYKGGMRFFALCGFDALGDYRKRLSQIHTISALLSAKPDNVVSFVEARLDEINLLKQSVANLIHGRVSLLASSVKETAGNLCLFDASLDGNALRELANAAGEKVGGMLGIFSGSDDGGYQFVIASRTVPLREKADALRAALGGKCGGGDKMLFGHADADETAIRAFFAE